MANPITNRVKHGKTPVIRKDLEGGVIAEANNDGSIYVDKDVKPGSPLEKEAIAHEKVHLNQMKRGDLNYDDNNVYWKGKTYPRSSMNEGAKNLPWEKEAYEKTKHLAKKVKQEETKSKSMKKNKKSSAMKMSDADLVANNYQTHKRFNNVAKSMIQDPMEGKATPITYKSSALKKTAAVKAFQAMYGDGDSKKQFKGIQDATGKYGTFDVTTKKDIAKGFSQGSDLPMAKGGEQATNEGAYMAGLRSKFPYATGAELGEKKYILSSRAAEFDTKYPAAKRPSTPSNGGEKKEVKFKQDIEKIKGTPGKEGEYQMGFWEASSLAAARKGMQKQQLKQQKLREKDAKRFDKYKKQGKTLYKASGEAFDMSDPGAKAEYLKMRASTAPDFTKRVGKVSGGTLSTLPGVKGATEASEIAKGAKRFDAQGREVINDPNKPLSQKGRATKARLMGMGIPSGLQMKNSAFKMGGYGSKTYKNKK